MLEELLSRINKKYTLTPIDSSEFDGIKVAHMRFEIKGYTAEGLGSVSTMTAKGFIRLMKMDTLIVIPREIWLHIWKHNALL